MAYVMRRNGGTIEYDYETADHIFPTEEKLIEAMITVLERTIVGDVIEIIDIGRQEKR